MTHFGYAFHTASEALPLLLQDILEQGTEISSRNGRVRELQNVHIDLSKPWKREILTPLRRASYAAQIAETAWVLAGRDDIEWLSHYLPRAPEFSDDGITWRGAYGPRIRQWNTGLDQLRFVIDELKNDPLSRRAVIQIYSPNVDTSPGKDIPCNNWLHFLSRKGRLDLHVAVRSNDVFWGWSGINAFEWSVLQEIVAHMLGIRVGTLHFSISSLHLYDRHWGRAQKIIDASEHPWMDLGTGTRFDGRRTVESLDRLLEDFFTVEQIIRLHGPKAAESAVDRFPEAMFQAWLRVLQAHWSGDPDYIPEGTAERQAFLSSPRRDVALQEEEEDVTSAVQATETPFERSDFLEFVTQLHTEKSLAYGDSWKKRGEMLGIMANIARKVDRLQGGETKDETSADTAIDLLVYLAKYHTWLYENVVEPWTCLGISDDPTYANQYLEGVDMEKGQHGVKLSWSAEGSVKFLDLAFNNLERAVTKQEKDRHEIVESMIGEAYLLARYLWEKQGEDEYRGADHE